MSTALHHFLPDDLDVAGSARTALLAGATLYVIDASVLTGLAPALRHRTDGTDTGP